MCPPSSEVPLFDSSSNTDGQPLAYRMRPRTIDEYVGQDHIVGPGRLLRRMIQADQLSSIIFYGPPGTGKTTLARVIANTTKSTFVTMNAVLSGVKDLRTAIAEARDRRSLHDTRTILFVDEVHRWNKAQQDALLPWVENGTVVLIGATTQNPYFEVISALVSRSRIFQLKPLNPEDLFAVARAALSDTVRGFGAYRVSFEEGALEHLVQVAGGDARSLLNALELAVVTTPEKFPPAPDTQLLITMDIAEESIQRKAVLYDKEGDYHFDTISAFIKSLRGSDPDAALYWMARMIHAGEDPHYVFRRMLILAGEDVGLADPQAIAVVTAAAAAFDRVGLPEGQFHLAEAALYLATAPKSNSTLAFFDAMKAVEEEAAEEVPSHLKDGNRDKEGFGHGEGYLYPHAYRDHWVAQQYLPGGLQGRVFYQPSDQGFEGKVGNEVKRRREAQLAAWVPGTDSEVLTYTPNDKARERWLSRVTSKRSEILSSIRDSIFAESDLQRHDRVLVLNVETGLILWEAYRQVPEGGVWGISPVDRDLQTIQHFSADLSQAERPIIIQNPLTSALPELSGKVSFEMVTGMNALLRHRKEERVSIFESLHKLTAGRTIVSLAEAVPKYAQRLSDLADRADQELIGLLRSAEEEVYNGGLLGMTDWDELVIQDEIETAGFKEVHSRVEEYTESRVISEKDLQSWFSNANPETPSYGSIVTGALGPEKTGEILKMLTSILSAKPVEWTRSVAYFRAQK